IARGSRGAAVRRLPGVVAAVFPHGPERGYYNNALLERGLGDVQRAAAVEALEAAYASASVTGYAAWVHESDEAMRGELARRGYAVTETTRAMGLALADLRVPRPERGLAPAGWPAYVAHL